MSPAVGRSIHENGHNSMIATTNGGTAAGGATRDSFLNYFFGKEGGLPSGGTNAIGGTTASATGTRHVSHNTEPSFSQSIRRGAPRHNERPPYTQDDYDVPHLPSSTYTDYDSFPPSNSQGDPELTEREALETELIRRLISSYFNIVRETIADQVPKAVMHLLVNHSKDVVQNRLVSELYREEYFGDLLYEDDGIKAEREKCEKLLGKSFSPYIPRLNPLHAFEDLSSNYKNRHI